MRGRNQVIGDPNHAQEVFTKPTLPLANPVCTTPAIPVRADESTGVVDGLGMKAPNANCKKRFLSTILPILRGGAEWDAIYRRKNQIF
jgi:hypothetical protein